MGTTLVVNPGSSSKKYALYCEGTCVLEVRYESTQTGFEVCTRTMDGQQVYEAVGQADFDGALEQVVEAVRTHIEKYRLAEVAQVVVRVVAPGTFFQQHAFVTEGYLTELKKREATAPLHIPTILRELHNVKKWLPSTTLIAASDSAFHQWMPKRARESSLSTADVAGFDLYRFGYHGLSVSSVVRRIHSVLGVDPDRLIVCHIGSGVSVTAVQAGVSIDTTMSYSPTSGLPMGTRAGDVDGATLLALMKAKNIRPAEADVYLNTQGGLTGLAQESDIRVLLKRWSQGDEAAVHALDVFAYKIQQAIAGMTVALSGCDALVFTGTAGVRSSELRALILKRLAHLQMHISEERNDLMVGKGGIISVRNSPVKIVVLRSDEMGEMNAVVPLLGVAKEAVKTDRK